MPTDHIKVIFDFNDGSPIGSEAIWAEVTKEGRYIIANIPFFAYDVNLGDEIEVALSETDDCYHFTRVVDYCGNCTFRAVFAEGLDPGDFLPDLKTAVEAHQGHVEAGFKSMVAISVPSDRVEGIDALLGQYEKSGVFDAVETAGRPYLSDENDADHSPTIN